MSNFRLFYLESQPYRLLSCLKEVHCCTRPINILSVKLTLGYFRYTATLTSLKNAPASVALPGKFNSPKLKKTGFFPKIRNDMGLLIAADERTRSAQLSRRTTPSKSPSKSPPDAKRAVTDAFKEHTKNQEMTPQDLDLLIKKLQAIKMKQGAETKASSTSTAPAPAAATTSSQSPPRPGSSSGASARKSRGP